MATLVVCLDGTNQTKSQQYPTNIARIFDSLGGGAAAVDADGACEFAAGGVSAKYLPGVGTQGDPALKVLGNLFGDGIAQPIVRGYTFLSRTYQPGDDIVLTGFSRGATAARALAGFVVGRGLLDPTQYDPTDKHAAYLRAIAAWYLYRQGNERLADPTRPDHIEDLTGEALPQLTGAAFIAPPRVKAVAVFDTVSSLGLPHLDGNGDAVFDFSICDTKLADEVDHGFHALAADEMRELFTPTFWADRVQVVQQVFPGCHSDVGGGFPHRGLSDRALQWMVGNLAGVGLACDTGLLHPPLAPDSRDDAEDDGATFPFNLTPRRARLFPGIVTVSQSLADRMAAPPTVMLPHSQPTAYRPRGTRADGSPL